MKNTTHSHRKMVLVALASVALLTSPVRAQTVTAQLGDLILGFRASGGTGSAVNVEIDLGSISNFYNGTSSGMTLSNLVVQDIVDAYGADWSTRTDLFWGAAATDGTAGSDPNGKPASTLWVSWVPNGTNAPSTQTSGVQGNAAAKIAGLYTLGSGSLNGAPSTTNSSEAADINSSLTGSWSVQETSGNSFGLFNPKIDGQACCVSTLDLYELQPSNFPHPAGTLIGALLLTQSGISFQATVPDPFVTWQSHYFTGSTLNSSPNADPLGKGISNTNQFLAGFNPTNSAAYPHVISIAKTNTMDINVVYLGASGDSTYAGGPASRTNVLEFTTGTANGSYSNDFISTGQTNILSGGTGLGVVANMVDGGGATNKPARYYRVRVLLP